MAAINDFIQWFKWETGADTYCASVYGDKCANYYRNGKIYADRQGWLPRDTDTRITEQEFRSMIGELTKPYQK